MKDNVTILPVKPRGSRDRMLQLLPKKTGDCDHYSGPFYYDEKLTEVECGACRTKLNPIWVLSFLGNRESMWMQNREAYLKIKAEHEGRTRCKCQHCGQMTRIRGM